MFELSVARKYLTPRWRQLSVSIISLISILVIALVVWLIVVFFSVTYGLERSWINKLIALTAPVRVMPTPAYYQSYYYQSDSISSGSDYGYKSIGEKGAAEKSDPYDPAVDEELPKGWPQPEHKDFVKEAFAAIADIPGLAAKDFEMGGANLHLQLVRGQAMSEIKQGSYVGTFPAVNPNLTKTLLPLTLADWTNLLQQKDAPLDALFEAVQITQLKAPETRWNLPKVLYPEQGSFEAYSISRDGRLLSIGLPFEKGQAKFLSQEMAQHNFDAVIGPLQFKGGKPFFNGNPLPAKVPVTLIGAIELPATVKQNSPLRFHVEFSIQGQTLQGNIPLSGLQIGAAKVHTQSPTLTPRWVYTDAEGHFHLPEGGILLPRSYREVGVRVGDKGTISYVAPSSSSLQEQRTPVVVAGFYDPGIIPLGGKFVLANPSLVSAVRSVTGFEDNSNSNGINVYFDDLDQAPAVKERLEKAFSEAGIAPYWKVETYREFEFTKDLIQQLRSEKNLFSLLAALIIIVACSNIISMLIILVNDKKTEIGILRSMGATSGSIALIFGTCGIVMGVLGSAIGILAALITLNNLQSLVGLISRVQGYELFNSHFYGEVLPNELSFGTLGSVIIATAIISLIAGLVPAIKASCLRPSAILRAE